MIERVRAWRRKRREAKMEHAYWLAEERRAGRDWEKADPGTDPKLVPDAPKHAREYDRDGTSTRLPLT